jgi:hypothetical protein
MEDRQELIDNRGTVARSGTRAFMSKLADAKDCAGLIVNSAWASTQLSWWRSASRSPDKPSTIREATRQDERLT